MILFFRELRTSISRKIRPAAHPGKSTPAGRTVSHSQPLCSLGFKFTIFTFSLIALVTYLVATTVTNIMDDALLHSMLQRGIAITDTVTGPAGYSILSEDRLALDNLAARIHASQSEMVYLAILDKNHRVLAHNQLDLTGETFPELDGNVLYHQNRITVHELVRSGKQIFEFRSPISVAGQSVGEVVIALDTKELLDSRETAHQKITLSALAVLALGIIGALLLAKFFSRLISRLNTAVSRIKQGEHEVSVQVTSRDEIGTLTRNFNDMSRVIRVQRDNLIHYASDLEESYNAIVRTLAGALDARDNYTYGHSARVATLAAGVGRRLDFGHEELKELEMACLLHDIGKIRVPDQILNKEGRLDDLEYNCIKEHPVYGAQILELADSLQKYIPAVLHHHEYFDGSGYPHQLRGDAIPLHAQIISLADAYDAMTTSRPYRPGRSRAAAIAEITAFKGRQFDPKLADLLIDALADYDEADVFPQIEDALCG